MQQYDDDPFVLGAGIIHSAGVMKMCLSCVFCLNFRVGLDGWPQVFCRELGAGRALSVSSTSDMGLATPAGLPISKLSPWCYTNTSPNMAECPLGDNPECDHNEDQYIVCQGIFLISSSFQS